MKFDELNTQLTKNIVENHPKTINSKGRALLDEYNNFINILHEWVDKKHVVEILSMISSKKIGTEKFTKASRLHTISNGGQTDISTDFSFSNKDNLLGYIDE